MRLIKSSLRLISMTTNNATYLDTMTAKELREHGMCSLRWDQVAVANAHPAPTAAQLARAAKLDADHTSWRNREGISTDNIGGEYELSVICADLSRRADVARHADHVEIWTLRHIATGEILPRATATQYGSAWRHLGKWIGASLTLATWKRKGYEVVRAWVPATREEIGPAVSL